MKAKVNKKTDAPVNLENFNFETALQELTTIVNKMEAGGLSLEDALNNFERGIALTRQCQQALKAAEQKVQILIEKNGEAHFEKFDSDETEE